MVMGDLRSKKGEVTAGTSRCFRAQVGTGGPEDADAENGQ